MKRKILISILILLIVFSGYILYLHFTDVKNSKKDDNKDVIEVNKPEEQEVVVPEKKVQVIDLDSDTRPYAVMINCKS